MRRAKTSPVIPFEVTQIKTTKIGYRPQGVGGTGQLLNVEVQSESSRVIYPGDLPNRVETESIDPMWPTRVGRVIFQERLKLKLVAENCGSSRSESVTGVGLIL